MVEDKITAEPSYEAMFARWVSIVQWDSGTRDRAAAAVWRVGSGISTCSVDVGLGLGLLVRGDEDVGMYSGREIWVVKKVELRVTNSSAVV